MFFLQWKPGGKSVIQVRYKAADSLSRSLEVFIFENKVKHLYLHFYLGAKLSHDHSEISADGAEVP